MSETTHEDFAEHWSPARDAEFIDPKDLKLGKEFSRNPSDYEGSVHYLQRRKERTMIEDDVVEEAIEDGNVIDSTEGDVVIDYEWLNSTIRVILAPKEGIIESAYEVEE